MLSDSTAASAQFFAPYAEDTKTMARLSTKIEPENPRQSALSFFEHDMRQHLQSHTETWKEAVARYQGKPSFKEEFEVNRIFQLEAAIITMVLFDKPHMIEQAFVARNHAFASHRPENVITLNEARDIGTTNAIGYFYEEARKITQMIHPDLYNTKSAAKLRA